ncbi:hypothetical protein QJQ45_003377 [Haematococcus lacustris]|nr:hypothetical protein QJQ45_003377 [Haematococcus lacustris]
MIELLAKLLAIQLYAVLSALWVVRAVRPAPAGLPRLLRSLPVVIADLVAPLWLDPGTEALPITPVAGVLSLSAFKLLAFCMNRGPLALPLSPISFFTTLLLPIVPAQVFVVSGGAKIPDNQGGAERDTWQLLRDYGKQISCAALVAAVLVSFPDLHWFARHWLYSAVFDLLAAGATAWLGMPVAPAFNRPWMSESFADFWARRWNLSTTYMMRVMVYEPVMEGRLVARLDPTADPADLSPASAAVAAAAAHGTADSPAPAPAPAPVAKALSAVASEAEAMMAAPSPSSTSMSDLSDSSAYEALPSHGRASIGAAHAIAAGHHKAGLVQRRLGAGGQGRELEPAGPMGDKAAVSLGSSQGGVEGVGAAKGSGGTGGKGKELTGHTARPSKLRRLLGLQATFMFSGVWHILVFWYNTKVISMRWALFFIIQAPIVMAEALLLKAWRKAGLPLLPKPVRVVATNAALIAVAGPLFFGPADTTGFASRNLETVRPAVDLVRHWAQAAFTMLAPSLWLGTASGDEAQALKHSAWLPSETVSLPVAPGHLSDSVWDMLSTNNTETAIHAV